MSLKDVASLRLSCAGIQTSNCSWHIADANAVNNLIKALATQRQLETVEVAFASAILPPEADSDFSDSEEEDMDFGDHETVADEYGRVSSMTAKLFHPAWMAVCKLMENGELFRLR